MEHKNVRISDAIPQRPASFDNTVEQTLARVCQKEQQQEQQKETPVRAWKTETGTERKRRSWRSILSGVAIASLVVLCVGAIGGVVIKNTLFKSDNRPDPVSGTATQQPVGGVPAIRYHGMLYCISESGQEYAGEVDESVIQRTTEEPVSMSEWPAKEGQTNFGGISVPYAMTANGLVVQIDHEWKLFEPLLPDADGLFGAAYAQALSEQNALDREYARLKLIGEEAPEEVEANEFFIHQRLVRLQQICDIYNCVVSVEQTSDSVRLSQIAYAENVMYFAFAAPNSVRFDTEPVICMNGTQYNVIDDTDFFSLQNAQTEHYAFYEIQPGIISGERLITIEFGEARFCFRYNDDNHAITLPEDEAEFAAWFMTSASAETPEPSQKPVKIGKSYYLINNEPAYPYESLLWESGPEYNVDGESVEHKLADEKIRAEIPEAEYVTGMHFTILIKDGWTLDEIAIYNDICERIATVGRSELTVTEQRCTDPECVTTLQPGVYYVSALVENQDEQISKGSEIVIRLLVKEDTDPQPTETTAILEEFTSDSGVDMIGIAVLVPAKATVTVEFPNQSDWVRTNSEDVAQPVRIAFEKAAFAPDASDTEPVAAVEPIITITTADGESYRVDCPSVTFTTETGDTGEGAKDSYVSTFRFWEYDEETGYREAPAKGILFVCDFDGDGTDEEIWYELHGQYVAISVGDASINVDVAAGAEHVILLDLDPASEGLNLLVVSNGGSEDYSTAELHMKKGRFVRGPVINAYCTWDGDTLRGSSTQTDILGTKVGERTYHGEDLTPDSEWFDCEMIPSEDDIRNDRENLIEIGKLLHVVRDLPCTIDGADAVIPADSYVFMTRWHESGTLAEIRTEDGTTALIALQGADPDQYGYLIDGETQDMYFDNIFYAD